MADDERPPQPRTPADPDGPLLDVRDLRVRFGTGSGEFDAVKGISFSVDRGEVFGLVGESGSGKSATLRAILGLLPPSGRADAGHVRFKGQDLLGMSRSSLRRIRGSQVGLVSQNPFAALNPILRLDRQFENIMRANGRKLGRKASRERVQEILRAVGIPSPEQVAHGYAHQLSGGMAQRVVIGMSTLLLDPDLVMADEPTTALDLTVQRQVLDLLTNLSRDAGRSLLLVTHDLGVVAQYCDRVAVMRSGRIVETGPVSTCFREPQHEYTRMLLSSMPEWSGEGDRT